MNDDINQNNQEVNKLMCPECGEAFQDMRGLTSHGRHKHGLTKEELKNSLEDDLESEGNNVWKVVGGIGAVLLTILTLGRMR